MVFTLRLLCGVYIPRKDAKVQKLTEVTIIREKLLKIVLIRAANAASISK